MLLTLPPRLAVAAVGAGDATSVVAGESARNRSLVAAHLMPITWNHAGDYTHHHKNDHLSERRHHRRCHCRRNRTGNHEQRAHGGLSSYAAAPSQNRHLTELLGDDVHDSVDLADNALHFRTGNVGLGQGGLSFGIVLGPKLADNYFYNFPLGFSNGDRSHGVGDFIDCSQEIVGVFARIYPDGLQLSHKQYLFTIRSRHRQPADDSPRL